MAKEKIRCTWVAKKKPRYVEYHDTEWGVSVHDDQKHFELICLEGAQAGLNWETILNKREGYRATFHHFDPIKCATLSDAYLEQQLENTNIIRNRRKIDAVRRNARVFLTIQKEFKSFDTYVWSFVGGKQIVHELKRMDECTTTILESDTLAKDLKKRGMTFIGSTTIYAYMQSAGLVNDHLVDCFRYKSCLRK